MSLINDMLRNLEAKRPDDLAKQNLQREIRSLPAAAPGRSGLRAVLLLALAGLGFAGWLQLNGQLLPLLGIHPEPAPLSAAAPMPAQAPVAEPAPPVAAAEVQPPLIADNLKMAQDLIALPVPAAPVLAVPDPVAPPVNPPPKVDSEAVKPAPVLASGPVKIEKSPVLATPRDRADVEYRKAEAAIGAGRSGEALELLRAALKIDPSYVQVRQALLRQLLDSRKFEEALHVLQEGLEQQPAQTGWAMSLARLQLEQGDLAAADRTLVRSQAYAEGNADYAGFQGHLKSRLGAHRQAVAHYQRAARLAPAEGRWWLGLGLALEADGRATDSKEALRRALASGTLANDLAAVAEQHLR